jgi:hypothetical protein
MAYFLTNIARRHYILLLLLYRTHANNDVLQNKLNEIFSKLSTGLSDGIRPPATRTPGTKQDNDPPRPNHPPAYEVLFPQLVVY